MKSFRSKPVGWKGESHRHYLAAKGIKSKYFAKNIKLYRGTSVEEADQVKKTNKVDASKSQYKLGSSFFTSNPEEAAKYGDNIISVELPIDEKRTAISGGNVQIQDEQAEQIEGDSFLVKEGTPARAEDRDAPRKVTEVDADGKIVASVKLNYDSDSAINISDWKAKVKGGGHGKRLIQKLVAERPDLYHITTDGTTAAGRANLLKALPGWKFIDERQGASAASATLWRQDVIDYALDERGGRLGFIRVDPKLHSKYDEVEQ